MLSIWSGFKPANCDFIGGAGDAARDAGDAERGAGDAERDVDDGE